MSARGERGQRGRDQIADRFGSPVCLPGETHFRWRNVDDRNRHDFRRDPHRRSDKSGDEADRSPGANCFKPTSADGVCASPI
jgi:hypothetical protein